MCTMEASVSGAGGPSRRDLSEGAWRILSDHCPNLRLESGGARSFSQSPLGARRSRGGGPPAPDADAGPLATLLMVHPRPSPADAAFDSP